MGAPWSLARACLGARISVESGGARQILNALFSVYFSIYAVHTICTTFTTFNKYYYEYEYATM